MIVLNSFNNKRVIKDTKHCYLKINNKNNWSHNFKYKSKTFNKLIKPCMKNFSF